MAPNHMGGVSIKRRQKLDEFRAISGPSVIHATIPGTHLIWMPKTQGKKEGPTQRRPSTNPPLCIRHSNVVGQVPGCNVDGTLVQRNGLLQCPHTKGRTSNFVEWEILRVKLRNMFRWWQLQKKECSVPEGVASGNWTHRHCAELIDARFPVIGHSLSVTTVRGRTVKEKLPLFKM